MSVSIRDKTTGEWVQVAGHGKAEYGASTVRKGTVTFTIDPQTYTTVQVTFSTPMPDADYLVDVSFPAQQPISYYVINDKTKNGFCLFIKNNGAGIANASVTYTAFKLYTDTEYNNLLNNAVLTSDVTDAVTNGNMNPVTSNAVYDTITNLKPVDAVTNGNMRAVTSNAVYDALTDLTPVDAVENGNMKAVTSNAVAVGLPEYYSKRLTVTAYEAAQLYVTSAYLRGQKVLCKDGKTRIFGKIILGGVGNPNCGINKHPCKLTGFPGPVTILTGRLPCLIWSCWTGFYSMEVVDVANNILAPIIAGPDHSSNNEACFTPTDVVVEINE